MWSGAVVRISRVASHPPRAVPLSALRACTSQSQRPKPEFLEDDGEPEVKPRGRGRIFLAATFTGSVIYSLISYNEESFATAGVPFATSEPSITIQRLFGVWQRVYAGLTKKSTDVKDYFSNPPKEKLLPALEIAPGQPLPLTLCIDLEHTLMVSEWTREHGHRYRKRPFAKEFLKGAAEAGVEVVIFSTNSNFLTDGITVALDPKGQYVHHRLGKEYTVYRDGHYIKDMSMLNRDLSRVVMVDDDPTTYQLQPENALPISKWTGDKSDTALRDMLPVIRELAHASNDVRVTLKELKNGRDIGAELRERATKRAQKQSRIASILSKPLDPNAPSVPKPAPLTPKPPQPAETPKNGEAKEGKVWSWLKARGEREALKEQQLQEEWMRRQQEEAQTRPRED